MPVAGGRKNEEDGASDEYGPEEAGETGSLGQLSPPHRTALAKLRSVIEWLAHALGGAVSDDLSQPKYDRFWTPLLALSCCFASLTGYAIIWAVPSSARKAIWHCCAGLEVVLFVYFGQRMAHGSMLDKSLEQIAIWLEGPLRPKHLI